MIDINGPEILVLLVLAVIIFGPEKLPDLARKAARVLNYLRGIANDAQGRLREELGPEFADLNLANLNPKALAASVLDPVNRGQRHRGPRQPHPDRGRVVRVTIVRSRSGAGRRGHGPASIGAIRHRGNLTAGSRSPLARGGSLVP